MKIKQVVTLLSGIALSSLMLNSAPLAAKQRAERWFDIEVILISQLADKSQLKEEFASNITLPKFNKPLDLLSPYLTPNIAHLKQKLPFCNSANKHYQYHKSTTTPSIINLKSLAVLSAEVTDEGRIHLNEQQTETSSPLRNQADTFFDEVLTEKERGIASNSTAVQTSNLATEPTLESVQSATPKTALNILENKDILPLTNKQQALLNAAEQQFSSIQFTYSAYSKTAQVNNNNLLCQITESEFNALSPNNERYSYLGFPISKVPEKISAIEDLYNSKPYLLNSDSLALHDIVKQLKRSRDFKPLLHIGWRQPVGNKRQIIPIELFAGDNLQQHYLKELELYQQQKAQAVDQEQLLNSLVSSDRTNPNTLAQDQVNEGKRQQLNEIIKQLPTINDDTATLINSLEQTQTSLISNESLLQSPPLPPLQPWYLQGAMQIYINNNNRLNIIADFNLLNKTLAEQATLALTPDAEVNLQTISFKQRRQVISTETHYFDHPYLGMIVQIRRHKRPKPPVVESDIKIN